MNTNGEDELLRQRRVEDRLLVLETEFRFMREGVAGLKTSIDTLNGTLKTSVESLSERLQLQSKFQDRVVGAILLAGALMALVAKVWR